MRKTEMLWIAAAAGLALYLYFRGGCASCAASATAVNYNAYTGPYRDWQ